MPIGLGAATPSPTGSTNVVYPFAASTSFGALDTQSSSDPVTIRDRLIPSPVQQCKPFHGPIRDLDRVRGPVARTSNPMLATSFAAHSSKSSPPTMSAKDITGRLERDFVLVQSLGRGEFSQVWKVRDKKVGRLWAVKAGKSYTGYKNRCVLHYQHDTRIDEIQG